MKEYADYVTHHEGGLGAVRELCELVMQAQGTYDRVMAPYLA